MTVLLESELNSQRDFQFYVQNFLFSYSKLPLSFAIIYDLKLDKLALSIWNLFNLNDLNYKKERAFVYNQQRGLQDIIESRQEVGSYT